MADEKPKKASAKKSKPKKAGAKKSAAKKSGAKSSSKGAKSAAKKSSKPKAKTSAKKAPNKSGSTSTSSSKPGTKKSPRPTVGLDKSIAQFRDSLEHSVTLSRERIQEVVDDAVKRGRMTHGDAEKMI